MNITNNSSDNMMNNNHQEDQHPPRPPSFITQVNDPIEKSILSDETSRPMDSEESTADPGQFDVNSVDDFPPLPSTNKTKKVVVSSSSTFTF